MSVGSTDTVISYINHKLNELPKTNTTSKSCIPRIDVHFRCVGSDDIYEPEMLSIGPYHHGNPRFQYMEQLKYIYLKRLLRRRNGSVDRYVNVVAAMEKQARQCYEEPINLDENQFMTLLVLDGIFLVEFFRCYRYKSLRGVDDPIFRDEKRKDQLHRDILLLENQLPLFVLHQLFYMTTDTDDGVISDENGLIDLALGFVRYNVQYSLSVSPVWGDNSAADHLLGLIHDSLFLSFAEKISPEPQDNYYLGKFINSITGLEEAGIKFKLGYDNHLMDIRFVKGELIIPQLIISEEVKSQLRNLIVHEQYLPEGKPRYVSDYTFFMYCLVKTSKDVELLGSHGIILNCLGSDEEICWLFSRLGRNTAISFDFTYSQVFSSLNIHCVQRRNRLKANLRKNYFNSPWSIISFLAAVFLLILTMAQTFYTVLAYYYR